MSWQSVRSSSSSSSKKKSPYRSTCMLSVTWAANLPIVCLCEDQCVQLIIPSNAMKALPHISVAPGSKSKRKYTQQDRRSKHTHTHCWGGNPCVSESLAIGKKNTSIFRLPMKAGESKTMQRCHFPCPAPRKRMKPGVEWLFSERGSEMWCKIHFTLDKSCKCC